MFEIPGVDVSLSVVEVTNPVNGSLFGELVPGSSHGVLKELFPGGSFSKGLHLVRDAM